MFGKLFRKYIVEKIQNKNLLGIKSPIFIYDYTVHQLFKISNYLKLSWT